MIQIVRSCRWGRLPSCRRPSPSGKLQVSPQCPLHYRNNRYLDIWCHTRDDVCGPGTDAISNLEVLASTIKEVSTKNIDQALGTGHGSLPLRIPGQASIHPQRACCVVGEIRHPLQESSLEADCNYLLSFPYAVDLELLGDIMRFGSDAQVLAPNTLKKQKHFLRIRSTWT